VNFAADLNQDVNAARNAARAAEKKATEKVKHDAAFAEFMSMPTNRLIVSHLTKNAQSETTETLMAILRTAFDVGIAVGGMDSVLSVIDSIMSPPRNRRSPLDEMFEEIARRGARPPR